MEKSKMIIVEGPQGTGKTTLTNFLRDNLPGSNLYRLSGQKDKTLKGKQMSEVMYNALLDYLKIMSNIPIDLIFDRTFFTEEVYARLGYKDYDFNDVYQKLVDKLENLDYNIYLFLLYLKDINLYRKRLDRKSHHNYQSFSIENSINQQNAYLELCGELANSKIKIIPLSMDDFDITYEKISEMLDIGTLKGEKENGSRIRKK